MCVWLCVYCMCILQRVSRVAHVNDSVEDLREDWSNRGVSVSFCALLCVTMLSLSILVCLYCRL